jgi:hypothetical protein
MGFIAFGAMDAVNCWHLDMSGRKAKDQANCHCQTQNTVFAPMLPNTGGRSMAVLA